MDATDSRVRITIGHVGETAIGIARDGKAALITIDRNIFHTSNGGEFWREVAVEDLGKAATLVFSPDLATMLAYDDERMTVVHPAPSRSWSGGRTLAGMKIVNMAIAKDGRVAAAVGADGSLHLSRDGGRNWAAVKTAPGRVETVALADDGATLAIVGAGRDPLHRAFVSSGR